MKSDISFVRSAVDTVKSDGSVTDADSPVKAGGGSVMTQAVADSCSVTDTEGSVEVDSSMIGADLAAWIGLTA